MIEAPALEHIHAGAMNILLLSGHSGHGRTCREFDPIANHRTPTSPRRVISSLAVRSQFCRVSSFALLEHRFEFFFERSRRNAEHAKPRQVVRGCGVDLHKLDLIAGEGGRGNISATPASASHNANGIRISTGRKPALRATVRNNSSNE